MRMLVRGKTRVEAPAAVVWQYVTDWPRQGEWMPFTHVELEPREPGDRARGLGGRFRAWTGLGPLGFWDTITLTAWEEEPGGSARCEIMHTGRVVRGDAELRVVPDGPGASRVTLWEHLEVPGGPVGALLWRVLGRVVGPLLDAGADLVLRRMARRAVGLSGGATNA